MLISDTILTLIFILFSFFASTNTLMWVLKLENYFHTPIPYLSIKEVGHLWVSFESFICQMTNQGRAQTKTGVSYPFFFFADSASVSAVTTKYIFSKEKSNPASF